MKILIVAPFPPSVIRKRDFNFVKILIEKEYDIQWVCVLENRENVDNIIESGERFKIKKFSINKVNSILNTLIGLTPFSKYPLQSYFTHSRAMGKYLAKITKNEHFDVIHYVHIRSTIYEKYINKKFRTKSLIDLPDCSTFSYSNIYQRIKWKNVINKLIYGIEKLKIANYENRLPIRNLILISETECRRFKNSLSNHSRYELHVVGNGLNPQSTSENTHINQNCNQITFLGKMSYISNQLLIEEFYTNVYSKLSTDEKFTFQIVGSEPPQSITNLELVDKSIKVTGYVEDTSEYLRNSLIFIATFRTGSGVQNKVLEAMQHECIVICSSIVAEPLKLKHEYNAIISDEDEQTISYIRDISSNPTKYSHIQKNGALFANNYNSWQNSVNKMIKIYKDISD